MIYNMHVLSDEVFPDQVCDAWISEDNYSYLKCWILSQEHARKSIVIGDDFPREVELSHDEYVNLYYARRFKAEQLGDKKGKQGTYRGSDYYYEWKRRQMQLAWEYLRKCEDYRKDYSQLDMLMAKSLMMMVEAATRYYEKSGYASQDLLVALEGSSYSKKVLSSWLRFVKSEEFSNHILQQYLQSPSEFDDLYFSIVGLRDELCQKWKIDGSFGPIPYYYVGPPVFVGSYDNVELSMRHLDVFGFRSNGKWRLNWSPDKDISPYPGVALIFDFTRDLDSQIHEARERLMEIAQQYGYCFPDVKTNISRPRDNYHINYIRVLDAMLSGVRHPTQLAEFIQVNNNKYLSNPTDSMGYTMSRAKEYAKKDYFAIATLPFRK